MEKILTDEEIKALKDEYYATKDKIRELEKRTGEIDATIVRNSCNIVASRFIPLKFGDKIRVTFKVWRYLGYETEVKEGFFGSFYMDDRHPYTEDNGVYSVKLRLYQIKKDGTRSQKSDYVFASNIVSIEKLEDSKYENE
jgi:hypothetical protein